MAQVGAGSTGDGTPGHHRRGDCARRWVSTLRLWPRFAAPAPRLRQESNWPRIDRSRRQLAAALDRLIRELPIKPPPLAQIQAISWEARPVRNDERFCIEHSDADASSPIFISPDIATCDDCRNELFDLSDRRGIGYPFLNCTNCGPRLTIITGTPYNRANTTMGSFPMCPECAAEYHDPNNRRFHAQPTACAVCGPRLDGLPIRRRADRNSQSGRFFCRRITARTDWRAQGVRRISSRLHGGRRADRPRAAASQRSR